MGKVLRIDLTRAKISEEPLSEDYVKKYLGGHGVAARILLEEVPAWAGAFDSTNRLIFATGPIQGTITPVAGRFCVVTKSPLTGYFGDANAGGFFGSEMKFSGYDFIVITGQSLKPVYLWVLDGQAELKDASAYWGMDARETDKALRKDLGDDGIKVADIGQAGENMVRYAAIMSDEASRAAARCGVGAVMGFMKLKAVAVRGHMKVPVADEKRLAEYNKQVVDKVKSAKHTIRFGKYGTPGNYLGNIIVGDSPVRNWTRGMFEEAENLAAGEGGYDKILKPNRTCYGCPVHCRPRVEVLSERYSTEGEVEGPEYETIAALGSNCEIGDIEAVAKANDLCNRYGLDTISVGASISFAMECYEKDLLTRTDTEGIDLTFGNAEAVIEMLHKIAKRDGIGHLLAEGSRRAAEVIGGEAEQYAIHVKGQEIAMHDPRAGIGAGINYATSNTGGRHTEGIPIGFEIRGATLPDLGITGKFDRFAFKGKSELVYKIQNFWAGIFAAGWCLNATGHGYKPSLFPMFCSAVTGIDVSFEDLVKIGERIFNLKRVFNVLCGSKPSEDTLPPRLLEESHLNGESKGSLAKLDSLREYYKLRGWNPETGWPEKEKLTRIDMSDVAETLYA